MLLVLLFVKETLKNPTCLALDKVAVFVPFDGKNPSAFDKVTTLDLPKIHKFKDIVVNP